jgi:thioredoxin reductase (NADPH)
MKEDQTVFDITIIGGGPTAVNNAKTFIDPKAKAQPLHSSSMFK